MTLTEKQAAGLAEQKQQAEQETERCDNCRKETDELFQVWDEKVCKECYRIYKENERINAREEQNEELRKTKGRQ